MAAFEYRQAEEIRDALRAHGVRYLFIGKSGAILLGFPDTTQDADLFVDRSPENCRALVDALQTAGFALTAAEASEPGVVTVDDNGNIVTLGATVTTTITGLAGEPVDPRPATVVAPPHVLVIGDSVAVGATPALQRALDGDVTIDAAVGRQFAVLGDVIRFYTERDRLPANLVIHLGSNGPVSDKVLDDALGALAPGTRAFVVNVRVPKPWSGSSNAAIERAVTRWPDTARLVDWNAASRAHGDWFAADGVHLTVAGGDAYAALIKAAIDAP